MNVVSGNINAKIKNQSETSTGEPKNVKILKDVFILYLCKNKDLFEPQLKKVE